MPDLGQDLYESYLLAMARYDININQGWHKLSDTEKEAWREAANNFARLLS